MRGYHKCTHKQVIKLAALLYRARFGADDKRFSKFRSEKPRRESLNGVSAGFQAANHPSSIYQSEYHNPNSAGVGGGLLSNSWYERLWQF